MSHLTVIRTRNLSFHRNNKRLWITPKAVSEAGLNAADVIYIDYKSNSKRPTLTISKTPNESSSPARVADTARGGLIDINNKDFTAHFNDYEKVQIEVVAGGFVITGNLHESKIIEREESIKSRVKTAQPIRKGGLFSGLGLLCRSIHRGLKTSGVNVKQRFANEYADLPAEVNAAGNEIWKDAFEDAIFLHDDIYTMDMSLVPKLDVVVMGSPCPAFSQANTTMKKDGKTDIFHPESGTIFQPILNFIQASNPALVVLENSRYFKDSIFDYIMTDLMNRFGYNQMDTLVTGRMFGAFEKRERLCRVWVSKGLGLPDVKELLKLQSKNTRTVADILEPIDPEASNWGRRTYLEAKGAQEHNGHKYCVTQPTATELPIMGANYHKIQADSPQIPHPTKEWFTRILTPSEHCNTRNIDGPLKAQIVAVANGTHPAKENTRTSASAAHKMLGNSVTPEAWEAVGSWLGSWLLAVAGGQSDLGLASHEIESGVSADDFAEQLGLSFAA
jgi:DNA (cytosine-5)-methyltransferase 1